MAPRSAPGAGHSGDVRGFGRFHESRPERDRPEQGVPAAASPGPPWTGWEAAAPGAVRPERRPPARHSSRDAPQRDPRSPDRRAESPALAGRRGGLAQCAELAQPQRARPGRPFRRNTTAAVPRRVHTCEKRFACAWCRQTSSRLANVTGRRRVRSASGPARAATAAALSPHHQLADRQPRPPRGEALRAPPSAPPCSGARGPPRAQAPGVRGGREGEKSDPVTRRRTHTGERPSQCPQDGEAFGQKAHLSVPLTIHTGEKPHRCHPPRRKALPGRRMPKAFVCKTTLVQHGRIHAGEKS
ncbi:hypothetical protein MC885_002731 [Smutsia gigantea]|nr:hypothetical protein MC885_002731 [Smutsia gigantea]